MPQEIRGVPDTQVRLFPRRKLGGGQAPEKGRAPLRVDNDQIRSMFSRPQACAAKELGISLTALKQICRKLSIVRWPYRRPKLGAKREARSSGAVARGRSCSNQDTPSDDGSEHEVITAQINNVSTRSVEPCNSRPIFLSFSRLDDDPDHAKHLSTLVEAEAESTRRACSEEDEGDDLSWMAAVPQDGFELAYLQHDNWLLPNNASVTEKRYEPWTGKMRDDKKLEQAYFGNPLPSSSTEEAAECGTLASVN